MSVYSDLFVKFQWHELNIKLSSAESVLSNDLKPYKAILMVCYFNDLDQAKKNMERKWLYKGGFYTFVAGYLELENGNDNAVRKAIAILKRGKDALWMNWLNLELLGRSRRFKKQAVLLKKVIQKNKNLDWPYLACYLSLRHDNIEPKYLIDIVSSVQSQSGVKYLLELRLYRSLDDGDMKLSRFMNSDHCDEICRTNPYVYDERAALELSKLNIKTALKYWDKAAISGVISVENIDQWIGLSLSDNAQQEIIESRCIQGAKLSLPGSVRQISVLSYVVISLWVKGDYLKLSNFILKYKRFSTSEVRANERNQQVFFNLASRLIEYKKYHEEYYVYDLNERIPMCVIGESHSFSLNAIAFDVVGKRFMGESKFILGIKMWHLSLNRNNRFKEQFKSRVLDVPSNSYVMVCVGEIDCRVNEGIFHYAKKNMCSVEDVVNRTVDGYVDWLYEILLTKDLSGVLIHGVPAPAYDVEKYGLNNKQINDFLCMFELVNSRLKNKVVEIGWGFVDVYAATVDKDKKSNYKWHIDGNHIAPSFYVKALGDYVVMELD
jgi:hypothetical protein